MTTATDTPKRRALGKGLESLLPRVQATVAAAAETESKPLATEVAGRPQEISVGEIDRNPYQTRTRVDEQQLAELASSIAATGVVQPIIVRPLPNGRFQLIAGERRWLASQKAGKDTVPAILRQVSDEQAMEMTIVENLQRADLNPMEQARAFERLGHEFKLTQEQMAQRTGKDRASVSNFLRLFAPSRRGTGQSRKRRSNLRPRSRSSAARKPRDHPQSRPESFGALHVRAPNGELRSRPAQSGKET